MAKTVIIRGVELFYANLVKAHAPFGEEIWDVQVRTTDEAKKAELEEAGVKMKKHDDGYYHANVKRRTMNRKGEKNQPVAVVDAMKKPWDPSVLIGHGSQGNLKLFVYDWQQMGRSGTSAMLSAVQITDLVEYKGSNDVDFDVEGPAEEASNEEDF